MNFKKVFLFLWFLLWMPVWSVRAETLKMELTAEGLQLGNLNTQILQDIFSGYGYNDYIYMPDWKYPPVFLDQLPSDFDKIKDKNLRNRLFIQIIAPLAMLANERVMSERYDLLMIEKRFRQNEYFVPQDMKRLDELAQKYDVFTRMKNIEKYRIILQELSSKIDVVPPSILIAAAAAESNWGTAREVKLGNALYKKKVWYTDQGIKPLEDKDNSYRIKTYPTLLAAIEEYVLQFNNNVNFQNFRTLRGHLRHHQKTLKGRTMDYNMVNASPLENYAGLINYIITFYELVNLDEAELGDISLLRKKK